MNRTFRDLSPRIHSSAHIFESVTISGDVRIAATASVWPGSVLRGDVAGIAVGGSTNIQDGALVHTSSGLPVCIGSFVTIGHGAILHGCTVADDCLVGMGAIIMDGAVIEEHCIIGAGAVVTEGMRIPAGSLALGMPARIVRPLTDGEIEGIRRSAREYVQLAAEHLRAGLSR